MKQASHKIVNLNRRVPPNDAAAEIAVLGSILLCNNAIDEVADIILDEDFYSPANQLVYLAMQDLNARGEKIDPITLRNNLQQRGKLEEIGGQPAIERLLDDCPTSANVESYARIVAGKAMLRRMLNATLETQGLIYEGKQDDGKALSPEEVMDRAQGLLLGSARDAVEKPWLDMPAAVHGLMSYVDERQTGNVTPGISTGFYEINDLTGGFRAGEMTVLAGRPGMGKTALALTMAANVAALSMKPVLFLSLEMTAGRQNPQLEIRLSCSYARVPIKPLLFGKVLLEDDLHRLNEAAKALHEIPLFMSDDSSLNPMRLRARARRLKAENGGLAMIVVDYLQLMRSGEKFQSREQEVATLSRSMKLLGKELNCHMLVLSQLNRQLEGRPDKKPRLSDLRESGSLEQDADVVQFVYRESMYDDDCDEPNRAEIIVDKNRMGATGTVYLTWTGECARFDNYARGE